MRRTRRQTTVRRGARALAALGLALLSLAPAVALAQATVEVEVRAASSQGADGRVTLVGKSGGSTHSCETRGGRCTIEGVAGGRYTVRFAPKQGDAPPERTVMIPPSGRVSLIVASD